MSPSSSTSSNGITPVKATAQSLIASVESAGLRTDRPEFRSGDTIKVHARIVEGAKERIQVFEGVVIKRHRENAPTATFTVRKISYNVGVERTFLFHSPRIEKIEIVSRGIVRRARLFYLRPLRGKAARIKSRFGMNRLTEKPAGKTPDEAA